MIEAFLFAQLSPLVSLRAYGGEAPPGIVTPYIVYKQVSGIDKPISVSEVCKSDRWQIDSYAGGDYTAGRTLARAVHSALRGIVGVQGAICILSSALEGPDDLYNGDVEQHYQSSDYLIDWSD